MHQVVCGPGHSHSEKKVINNWYKALAVLVSVLLVASFWYNIMPKSFFEKGYITAKVTQNLSKSVSENALFEQEIQKVELKLKNGVVVEADYVVLADSNNSIDLVVGDTVVVNQINNVSEGSEFQIVDVYRLNLLMYLFVLLVLVACIFAGWNAIFSFIGLAFSVLVLVFVIVKGILAGYNPLLVSILGAFLISVVSVYLGHGFSRRTTIAIIGIVSTLLFVGVISVLFVKFASLFGMGSEEAFFLQLDSENGINLQGIFLAGIIIGTLGVLDDITTSQVAVVDELHKANNGLSSKELYSRAISVGKEHITALINTLVLAYAGASMPLFILFNQESIQPIWSLLNGEFLAEEIVRTLLGSLALILSVPVTTLLAAKFLYKNK